MALEKHNVVTATFSVKNLEKFQHYKDRSPPWIKLYNELLDDYDFGSLPDTAKWHLVAIWLLASRSGNKIPFDSDWVARRINATGTVDLDLLAARGFIVIDQALQTAEHDASAPLADRKQSACPEREGETEAEAEAETETEKDSGAPAPRPMIDDPFVRFWSAYPKRDGSNPRKPAQTKFEKLVRDGADPEAIIAGATRYADELAAQNKLNTVYVAQAKTWLHQERWRDTEPSKQAPAAMSKVFLAEDDPRWRVWEKYLIATRGRGPFVTERESDRKRGSWFDTEAPTSLPEAA
jgi:hypothetical protein